MDNISPFKIIIFQNVAANHRANDVIVKDGASQMLTARFMYGPLDMITLAGQVHIEVPTYIYKQCLLYATFVIILFQYG